MSQGHAYTVLLVEDQEKHVGTVEAAELALEADRQLGAPGEPYLTLFGIARNQDDAIQHLELAERLPDAIVIDDCLPEGATVQSRSIEIMAWLFERCAEEEVPAERMPRAVLWTSNDNPQLAYSFCVVGGMQFRDKRHPDGEEIPLDAVWEALAGRRWRPDPYPSGLTSAARRAALPWLEAGWSHAAILAEPRLRGEGVSEDTMRGALKEIREMARTPQPPSPDYPDNWTMAVHAAKRNGWVWVPLDRHRQIPVGAPLPLVIDPAAHRRPLPPVGPLPARVANPS